MPTRAVCIQLLHGPTLLDLNSSPRTEALHTMPSDDELLIACVQTFKRKYVALDSQIALPYGNVLAQAPHATYAERGSHSTHIQPMHQSALAKDTSTPPLKVVPAIIPFCTSTKGKSKISSRYNLDHVTIFVANLRGKASATHSTNMTGRFKLTLSLTLKGLQQTIETL
jgi:hypothetical protein